MNTKEVDLTKVINNKVVQIIFNILFGISTACLTLLLIEADIVDDYVYVVLPILSFIIVEVVAFRFKILQKLSKNFKLSVFWVSVLLGGYATYYICHRMRYTVIDNQVDILLLVAIPAMVIFLYYFYDKFIFYFKKYILSLDKIEKYYLIIGIIVLVVGINLIYNITDIFSYGDITARDSKIIENGSVVAGERAEKIENVIYISTYYNTLYTTDTRFIMKEDAYNNIATTQNDIKQPLFGVFAMPLNIIPKAISSVLPNGDNIYAILIAILQGTLALITFTLLSRLMKLKGSSKVIFLILLSVTYPTLLFLLNLEQYIISVFYLVIFIYFAMNDVKDKDVAYIMATGSMVTSGIFFPLLGEKKDIKKSIKNIFFTFLKCMAILIVSARISLVFPKEIKTQVDRIIRIFTSERRLFIN